MVEKPDVLVPAFLCRNCGAVVKRSPGAPECFNDMEIPRARPESDVRNWWSSEYLKIEFDGKSIKSYGMMPDYTPER